MSQPDEKRGIGTQLAHAPATTKDCSSFVNPPVIHASTVLFDTVQDMRERKQRYSYGRAGTPTSDALCDHLAKLEGCDGVLLTSSGLSAITTTMLGLLKAGDHVLITDSAYKPVRAFADGMLAQLGISVTYYPPDIGADIGHFITDETTLIYTESPGSLTFEIQDLPAIANAARARGVLVMADNTWATPLFYRPLDLGADVAIQAATKYIVGHSDALLGTISANGEILGKLTAQHRLLGQWCGPDDMYLAARGLRTMQIRLERHMATTLQICRVLEGHPLVTRVRYPALESDPGHALWKRDFTGASGLFGLDLVPGDEAAVGAFLNEMAFFGLGYSWGGFESLALYAQQQIVRNCTVIDPQSPLLRFQIGLEDPADLIADLMAGLDRYAKATGRAPGASA